MPIYNQCNWLIDSNYDCITVNVNIGILLILVSFTFIHYINKVSRIDLNIVCEM